MDGKHTKGPWFIGGSYKGFSIEDSNGTQVAHTNFWGDKEEHNANGFLIAASPELLGALIACESWLEPLTENPASESNGLNEIMAQVKAAISRAKGDSNGR